MAPEVQTHRLSAPHDSGAAGFIADWPLPGKDQQNYFFFLPPLSRDSAGAPASLAFADAAGLSVCLPATRAARFEIVISLTSYLIHRGM